MRRLNRFRVHSATARDISFREKDTAFVGAGDVSGIRAGELVRTERGAGLVAGRAEYFLLRFDGNSDVSGRCDGVEPDDYAHEPVRVGEEPDDPGCRD
jgi:hypothetical protein